MKMRSGLILVTLALATGCHSPMMNSVRNEAVPSNSGFLGDYSQLKPDPKREGALVYADRSVDFRQYSKLMFDPVQIIVTPSADQSRVPSEAIARMTADLMTSFQKALHPKYQIVTTAGPDVLRIRTAITGVQAVRPDRNVTDLIPIKAAFNLGREVTGTAPRVEEMTAEIELLDPQGKRVAAATANRKGDKTLPQGQQITWQDLTAITEYWGEGLRQGLDRLRGDMH
ncbi:DUF3313 domain-containing protein [Noviherbaspirillum cavernae]|uniref:DUF3313 domain-containing protein n=1 Tax=Noviherbaspirillum cavernae TaxID=2320862 RepID=A0A418X575_9BURK|nr:DUF3313 domain-containing protein [Noviherbaspirillum cavernae]RJG07569.1 DUF3313 domain-containing protein [Noviherbaspirillum cavernae]